MNMKLNQYEIPQLLWQGQQKNPKLEKNNFEISILNITQSQINNKNQRRLFYEFTFLLWHMTLRMFISFQTSLLVEGVYPHSLFKKPHLFDPTFLKTFRSPLTNQSMKSAARKYFWKYDFPKVSVLIILQRMKLPPCFPKGIKYGTFSDPSAYTIRRLRDQKYSVYLHSHFSYFKYFLKNIPVKFIHFLHHPKSLKLHILKVTMRMKSIIQTPYKHFYYHKRILPE